ncbi:MAG: Bifunctional transcriptional activator/DNA repair enzyme Ada [Microgenomates bacterium OLB23]|nr:MAG: Bifunctional transcriptional activator/DNA repair enzyme Ada [Microgenomates bacterium OLB23]
MSSNSQKIYNALQLIPKGKVTTYKLLAEYIGINNPRVIGNILHKNEDGNIYPCHRVVRSNGTIASGYAMGGPTEQRKKLRQEGVRFLSNGNVNFSYSLHTFSS